MNIAIIPARGGSKRIPNKNIRSFHGQPIIAYSIAAAIASGLFDQVLVSTDSDEIAAVAQNHGATFWRRPIEIADDYTGTQAVMRQALVELAKGGDLACCIYPTAPMMTAADLQAGLHALQHTEWDPSYAFAVTTYDFPVQRSLSLDGDPPGSVRADWPALAEQRSQDLEVHWHDAGQWYWGRASAFIRDERIYSPASIGVPIPRWRSQDIDTEEDFRMAELVYAALHGLNANA